jgi:excisionase family DNA binding protein
VASDQGQEQEFLTVAEVARKLRVSIDTVRNYIGRKKNPLPAYLLGREYRIRPDELEQWLQQQKNIQDD